MTIEGGGVSILLFQNERSKKDCLLGGGGQKMANLFWRNLWTIPYLILAIQNVLHLSFSLRLPKMLQNFLVTIFSKALR